MMMMMKQWAKTKKIKSLNNILDEIIDKSKSFEEQIQSLKKLEVLKGHCPCVDFGDKEWNSKYFKIENQRILNNINKNEEKLYEECETSYGRDWVIQPSSQHIYLIELLNLF